MSNPYEIGLDKNAANYVPLSPVGFLDRAAAVHPDRVALIHGATKRTWAETARRVRKLASALAKAGVGKGDTVAIITPNTPSIFECHLAVPMAGAVLNTINTRLDADTVAFILDHGEAKVFITDTELAPTIKLALSGISGAPLVVDYDDPEGPGGERLGSIEYEDFLNGGDADYVGPALGDEWDAICLNYTSGTTGDPKGVVYHYRGAYLNALGNILVWNLPQHPVYLWTLPMFHCNGWCFPWTITALAGTHVCLRQVSAANIYAAIAEHGVTHFCGAPIVLNMIINATNAEKRPLPHQVEVMTAAAPPPAAVLEAIEAQGFRITHVYGLTEVYGPAVVCAWHEEWNALPSMEQAAVKARQGVRYPVLEGLMVADPDTLAPVPSDGETIGEVFMRGNIVMKGYLKNSATTQKSFQGGWFHTGDLGVMHEDGYIELKDRSKDIIISGGENISSIEVENALYKHPKVLEAAVVARPDEKWGESPCAFVTLKAGEEASEDEMIAFCRENMASYKIPRTIVFGELPKTSTGKVQKFVLREKARSL